MIKTGRSVKGVPCCGFNSSGFCPGKEVSMITKNMYIGGKFIPAKDGAVMDVVDPYTGKVFAQIAKGGAADVKAAVTAAKAAQQAWRDTPPKERAAMLRKVHDLVQENKEALAALITKEMGMPQKYCEACQVDGALEEALYNAELAESYPYCDEKEGGMRVREPFGVVALLTPWNYPLDQITMKAFPAMAAGNCVVVKPSKKTPLTALVLAGIIHEAGVPAGVFNVVPAIGAEVGDALAEDPDIRLLSFTGSTKVGKQIGAKAVASNAKNIILEMGGKSAMVILEGADVDAAVAEVLASSFINTGQTCCAFTRLLVPASLKETVEAKIKEQAAAYVTGDPFDPAVDIGPIVTPDAFAKVKGYIESGIAEGATLLVGGVPENAPLIPPVVFTDVTMDMKIAKEEIFGPVLCVLTYENVDEAVRLANATEYGLDSAVWGPEEKALRVASRLEAGNVHINGAAYDIHLAFGGYKESGIGREGGLTGFELYLEEKAVFL